VRLVRGTTTLGVTAVTAHQADSWVSLPTAVVVAEHLMLAGAVTVVVAVEVHLDRLAVLGSQVKDTTVAAQLLWVVAVVAVVLVLELAVHQR
jgi:hypothetical protein